MNDAVHILNTQALPRQEDLAALRMLEEIERQPRISQREISRSLGVSLGLTNLLLRRMVHKTWIKVSSIPGHRVLYALTPRGIAEKFRRTRDFVRLSFRYYSEFKRSITGKVRALGLTHPRVATSGAGEMEGIAREAVEEAGGRYAGTVEAGMRRSRMDAILLLARVERTRRSAWERDGVKVVDLS